MALSDFVNRESIDSAFVKIDAEGEEIKILSDLLVADLSYLEGAVEFHPDKTATPVTDAIESFQESFDEFEFVGETSPQHEYSRPVYRFVKVSHETN
jgi:hypothetical protein